ncbi:MAG: hypothetical protein ABIH03_01735 [Pseudomonadota bacterium]
MAVNWIASFKHIPWTKVLTVAPSIADGARKLWSGITKKDALIPKPPAQEKAYSPDPVISAIEKQMQALELRAAELGKELVLSSEIIDKLAEQQSQLVQAVDVLRVRTRALIWVCGFLALDVILLIYLVVGRG